MLCGEATNTNFTVFGLTQSGLECYPLHHRCGFRRLKCDNFTNDDRHKVLTIYATANMTLKWSYKHLILSCNQRAMLIIVNILCLWLLLRCLWTQIYGQEMELSPRLLSKTVHLIVHFSWLEAYGGSMKPFSLLSLASEVKIINSQTCLNQTPLGLKNLFGLNRCLVYTGSNYIDI